MYDDVFGFMRLDLTVASGVVYVVPPRCEVHGVGLAAPDPSSKHAAPGGDSYDPWGSAHGEEDRRGRGSVFHGALF